MSVEKVICPVPWIMTSIRNNGDYRVCCHSSISDSMGIIKDSDDLPMNCKTHQINETRNAKILKELRKSMLNGEEHNICTRCTREEQNGLVSRRMQELRKVKDKFDLDTISENTSDDGAINLKKIQLTNLDVRFGNRCNLKCRMCGPTDSDAWYKEYVELWDEPFYDDSHGRVKLESRDGRVWTTEDGDYDWIDSDFFWKNLFQNIKDLEYIHTVGGEPLLIDKHYEMLEACVRLNVAKNIVLEYNTNGTIIPERALRIWKEFKEVRIGVSVDGVGQVNNYIRYPSKWKLIEENLEKLDKSEGNIYVWLSFTVQSLNVFYLDEFVKWKLTSKFHRIRTYYKKDIVSTHPLHSPRYLSIKILPQEVKEVVENKLRSLVPWFIKWSESEKLREDLKEAYLASIKKMINGYIDFMNSKDDSKYFDMFMEVQGRLDKLRNVSMSEELPEFYNIIKDYKNLDYEFKYLR